MLRIKIEADMPFPCDPAYKPGGKNKLRGRNFGEFAHEYGKVNIQGREKAAFLEAI